MGMTLLDYLLVVLIVITTLTILTFLKQRLEDWDVRTGWLDHAIKVLADLLKLITANDGRTDRRL